MALEIGYIPVTDLAFGARTEVVGSTLTVDRAELSDTLLRQDDRITGLHIALAKPGQAVRIICVKDVIEPRLKVHGKKQGAGRLHVLQNAAVVTCGQIVGFQEGIIDMSGPGAAHTPFSKTCNLVLEIDVAADLSPHQHEETVRHAGLRAAAFLGEAGRTVTPVAVETYEAVETAAVAASLPRVAYVYMLLSQGLLHDTYVCGRNAREGLPRPMPLLELLDGALTSGNCVSACDKNTTYHHQNNPVLRELYRRHGRELNFAGVVLTNEPVRLAAKRAAAAKTVELVQELAAAAAVITKEGFGNPDADQMMLIRLLEEAGIRTATITDEYAGPDGASQSLADTTPQADAVVSAGNANARIVLPPMERLIGPLKDLTRLAGAYPQSLRADGSLEIELQGLVGSTNQLGMQTLRCREV